ncbi:YciI family protein [Bacillus sp. FJAT-42376]|uniref:YciI family protein n=1 Tax=Bacillus sp. FJAT-42376 TaxID=2014076 RepID=UPI000F4F23D5|nr:YciI family protein [Bacillus sp. FJAT-42376]AZB41846.1 YciI family protein [Bacillus sp. FJAT-42376]
MRFLLIIKATEYSEAGLAGGKDYREAMISYKKSLAKKGALLADEELQPSSIGLRITYPMKGENPQVLAGPFPVNQDLIMEYMLINVSSEDEALNWALRMPVPKVRGKYEIELRRLKEKLESIQDPGIKAMEASLQDQLNVLKNL